MKKQPPLPGTEGYEEWAEEAAGRIYADDPPPRGERGRGFDSEEEAAEAAEAAAVPRDFALGHSTQIGPEIVLLAEDGEPFLVVDYLRGPPLRLHAYAEAAGGGEGYNDYRAFKEDALRTPTPPFTVWRTMEAAAEDVALRPQSIVVEAEGDDCRVTLGGGGTINMLYGPSESGKTWFVLELLRRIERPFVYIATEDEDGVYRKMRDMGWDPGPNRFVICSHPQPRDMMRLSEEAESIGAEVVVVDVVSLLLENVNDQRCWAELIGFLRPVAAGRTLLLVHHLGKDAGRGPLGASISVGWSTSTYETAPKVEDEGAGAFVFRLWKRKDRHFLRPSASALLVVDYSSGDGVKVRLCSAAAAQEAGYATGGGGADGGGEDRYGFHYVRDAWFRWMETQDKYPTATDLAADLEKDHPGTKLDSWRKIISESYAGSAPRMSRDPDLVKGSGKAVLLLTPAGMDAKKSLDERLRMLEENPF